MKPCNRIELDINWRSLINTDNSSRASACADDVTETDTGKVEAVAMRGAVAAGGDTTVVSVRHDGSGTLYTEDECRQRHLRQVRDSHGSTLRRNIDEIIDTVKMKMDFKGHRINRCEFMSLVLY